MRSVAVLVTLAFCCVGGSSASLHFREDVAASPISLPPPMVLRVGQGAAGTTGLSNTTAGVEQTVRPQPAEAMGITAHSGSWTVRVALTSASGLAAQDDLVVSLVGSQNLAQVVVVDGIVVQATGTAHALSAPGGLGMTVEGMLAGTAPRAIEAEVVAQAPGTTLRYAVSLLLSGPAGGGPGGGPGGGGPSGGSGP